MGISLSNNLKTLGSPMVNLLTTSLPKIAFHTEYDNDD